MTTYASKSGLVALCAAVVLLADGAGAVPLVRAHAVSACTAVGGTPRYAWDAVYNWHNSNSMNLECSLPTTFVGNEDEGEHAWFAWMYYTDPGAGSISCEFKVIDLDGDVIYTHGSSQTSSNGEGAFNWNLSPGYLGQPYAACTIPADGGGSSFGIQSFQVLHGPQ